MSKPDFRGQSAPPKTERPPVSWACSIAACGFKSADRVTVQRHIYREHWHCDGDVEAVRIEGSSTEVPPTVLLPRADVERVREALQEAFRVLDGSTGPMPGRAQAMSMCFRAAALLPPAEGGGDQCPACNGSRHADYAAVPCPACGGSGLAEGGGDV